jgi:hypothetical protein
MPRNAVETDKIAIPVGRTTIAVSALPLGAAVELDVVAA